MQHDMHVQAKSLRKETLKHALRCLLGCGVGEAAGAAIGMLLGWSLASTLALAIGLAFAFGYAFTMVPMLRTMPLRQAARVAVVGDTASIAEMEAAEISVAFAIPGFMMAGMHDATFWLGLGLVLPTGFAAAYPAMYWAMRREQKKGAHAHHH
jgi:uncharacterized membrane protein